MASVTLTMFVRVNRPRLRAIFQETIGELRRARRRDRPAIADRAVRRALTLCMRVVGQNGRPLNKPPHDFAKIPSIARMLAVEQSPTCSARSS